MRITLSRYISFINEPPLPTLLKVSLIAWGVMLLPGELHQVMSGRMIAVSVHGHGQMIHSLDGMLSFHSLAVMVLYWLVMLVAMMSPQLAQPIRHLWLRSLTRRRWIAIVLFLLGYVSIWTLAGLILMPVAALLRFFVGEGWFGASGVALLSVIFWQSSPWKQSCLNHCHWTPRLSPFGLAANLDCWRYGMVNGLWCVGNCWALMLLPLTVLQTHLIIMAVVTLILMFDRYRPVRLAKWRIPFEEKILNKLSQLSTRYGIGIDNSCMDLETFYRASLK